MDLGCHGIAFCYWFLGRTPIKTVYCQMGTYVHGDKTKAEDESLCILEFANGAVGLIENSWARRGGMDDRIEVFGEAGVTYANLHMGNALPTFSENGYGYAVEKAPTTKGWTYPVFEELWNYGTPQELRWRRPQDRPSVSAPARHKKAHRSLAQGSRARSALSKIPVESIVNRQFER
jgi:predicted dehydrogenase